MMGVKGLAKSHSVERWQSADTLLMARKCPHGFPDVLSLAGILDGDVCWPLSVTVTEHLSDPFVGGKLLIPHEFRGVSPCLRLYCLGPVVRQSIMEVGTEKLG